MKYRRSNDNPSIDKFVIVGSLK